MWVLIVLAGFVAVVCLAAFVRGSSSSYWDQPRLLDRDVTERGSHRRHVA